MGIMYIFHIEPCVFPLRKRVSRFLLATKAKWQTNLLCRKVERAEWKWIVLEYFSIIVISTN